MSIFIPLLIAIVSICIYLYTAAPFMLFEDSSRFAGAIMSLGVAQPAAPVYVFLAHWFTYLPFGSDIFRMQVFSAFFAGITLIVLYKLVIFLLKNFKASSKQPPRESLFIIAGIVSMLTLGFSYEFWSQAQNVERFIFVCFIEVIILFILLSNFTYTSVFKKLLIVAAICGIASGTDPVIISVFPAVLLVALDWKRSLGIKGFAYLAIVGSIGIVVAWSLLAVMASRHPLISYVDASTLQGIWKVAAGGGLNVYDPGIGLKNGFTWSFDVILVDAWYYLTSLFYSLTPVSFPFIFFGGRQLWKKQRHTFWILFSVILTNFVLSSIYYSGNKESWFLQSAVVLALFAGLGAFWCIKRLENKWPWANYKVLTAMALIIAIIPFFYWWPTLDRHAWHFTSDYIDNLYRPLKGPAIMIGSGDFWDASTAYMYGTKKRTDIIPVLGTYFYGFEWHRTKLARQTDAIIPNAPNLARTSPAEYSKLMNDFFAANIKKYHIYITHDVLRQRFFGGSNEPSLRIDTNRFALVPVGLVQEIVPKDKQSEVDLASFTYHFGNGFPQTKPYFLERSSTDEMNGVVTEMALSYDAVANYLAQSGQIEKAASFYKKAEKLAPDNAQVLADLGVFYGQQNQTERALSYFQKAHEYEPSSLGWLYNLAIAEENAGKIDKAKEHLQEIVSTSSSKDSIYNFATQRLARLQGQSAGSLGQQSVGVPVPTGWKPFIDQKMHLGFAYPSSYTVTQISDQQLSVVNPEHTGLTENMLIFATTGTNIDTVELPFLESSSEISKQPVTISGFKAVMKLYGAGAGPLQVLFLQKDNYIFVLRLPQGKGFDPNVFSQMIQSITLVQ